LHIFLKHLVLTTVKEETKYAKSLIECAKYNAIKVQTFPILAHFCDNFNIEKPSKVLQSSFPVPKCLFQKRDRQCQNRSCLSWVLTLLVVPARSSFSQSIIFLVLSLSFSSGQC